MSIPAMGCNAQIKKFVVMFLIKERIAEHIFHGEGLPKHHDGVTTFMAWSIIQEIFGLEYSRAESTRSPPDPLDRLINSKGTTPRIVLPRPIT
jgi:hypothetical protein